MAMANTCSNVMWWAVHGLRRPTTLASVVLLVTSVLLCGAWPDG